MTARRFGLSKAAGALLAVYAGLCAPVSAQEDGETGRALYDRHCLTCHQADGRGVPFMQPPLVGSAIVTGPPETLILWTLLGTPPGAGPSEWANAMPGFPQLSDMEIAALLTYLRQDFDHGADEALSAIVPDQVAPLRDGLP